MINDEVFMEIKILFRPGKNIREISRLLQVSRNTVRRYLRREEKPSYKNRQKRGVSKLAPFCNYLQTSVNEANPYRPRLQSFIAKLKNKGIKGSYL